MALLGLFFSGVDYYLILFSKAINNVASFLLLPYLAWVTLASVLNYETG